HRVRNGMIKARTAQANQLHGLLAEFGIALPQGMARLMSEVKIQLARDDSGLPPLMQELTQRLLSHLQGLDRQVQEIDKQIKQLARQSQLCRTLEQVPGIGPITATALVATVGSHINE
ncbi:IS110 family transposase, partial [Undibacterium sp. Di26W]